MQKSEPQEEKAARAGLSATPGEKSNPDDPKRKPRE